MMRFRRNSFKRDLASLLVPSSYIVWRGSHSRRSIALTFDDGPDRETRSLLDLLARLNVRATFFVVGERVDTDPGLVRDIVERNHEIGNHSYSHNGYHVGPLQNARDEIERANWAIQKAIGRLPVWFRPPFGALSWEAVTAAWSFGMTVAMWSVDTLDYRDLDMGMRAISSVKNGDIVLLHDDTLVAQQLVAEAVPRLRDRGFEFVTMSQLLRLK